MEEKKSNVELKNLNGNHFYKAKLAQMSPEDLARGGMLTQLLKWELEKISHHKEAKGKTKAQFFIEQLIEHATAGDAKIAGMIFDRIDGKLTDKLEIKAFKPKVIFNAKFKSDDEVMITNSLEITNKMLGDTLEIGITETARSEVVSEAK